MSAPNKNTTYTLEEMKRLIDQAIQHLNACKSSADFITEKTKQVLYDLCTISARVFNPCNERPVIGKYIAEAGYGKLFTKLWEALSVYLLDDRDTGNGIILRYMIQSYVNFFSISGVLKSDFGKDGQVHLLVQGLKHMMAHIDETEPASSVCQSRRVTTLKMLWILHNSILCDSNRQVYRAENVVATLKECMHKNLSEKCKTLCLIILAYVVDEKESRLLETLDGGIAYLVNLLKKVIESANHKESVGWTATGLLKGLKRLAVNDANKVEMEKQGCIPVLIRMLGEDFSEREQQAAAEALWTLAFEDSIRNSDQLQKAKGTIERLATSNNKNLQRACTSALWQINGGVRQKTGAPQELPLSYREAITEPVNAQSSSTQIMVSYQWDTKLSAMQVRDRLVAAGYRVWMDETNMRGDMLEAMADAIEKSDVILIGMTERYKESTNCRSEATYAYKLKKKVIPLLMEDGYEPDGWLGFLQGMKLYYKFHSDDQIQSNMEHLLKAIKECTVTGEDKGPTPMTKKDVRGASPVKSVTAVKEWSTDDVQDWLRKNNLSELCDTLDFCDGSQLEVLYDQYCQDLYKFKDEMRSDYEMSAKLSLKFAGALKKLFPK